MGGVRFELRHVRLVKLTLPGQLWAVPVARRCVADAMAGRGHGADGRELVKLLTSELVTNAVVHTASGAGGEFTLEAFEERVPGGPVSVVVVVFDQGSVSVPRARSARAEESSGRGLALVAELAVSWGFRLDTDRMRGSVWFEVALSAEGSGDGAAQDSAAVGRGRELAAGGVR
ncbi:ATP-binding protein [Nonomuraea sp. NPDC050394]|uniref:ATP-binding protein n=1 Tax=Nonomuraea sp. NPDC050394 TaxID=3364363 RepID=UPI0037B5195D